MKLFFLTSELGNSDAAGQLALLACGLVQHGFEAGVGVLGPATGPAADALRSAGVGVAALPLRHVLDFSGMRRLRHTVLGFGAPILHTFGPDAARTARLCLLSAEDGNAPRFVASAAQSATAGIGGWFTARQVRRADRVIATGWVEAERYREAGVTGDRLTRIAPAAPPGVEPPDRAAFCRDIGAPGDARFVFSGGHLDAAHGLKDAVMTFDMLRYVSPALNLVLTGDGPDRTGAENLGRALAFDDFRVRFTGCRADLPAAVRLADQVWVLCARGGACLALRAMAAGRPLIAYRTPEIEEIIDDGETGYLVAPGDRAALATKAQELFTDPETAARIGATAQKRAAERFGAARMVEQHARVYQELVG
ncbi:MAG TPA: glycosyltransferase [Gemmata sp.]